MNPFQNQPEEITRIQALNLPVKDLDRLSRVDSRFRNFIKNEAFWKAKYEHDYQTIANPWEKLTRLENTLDQVATSILRPYYYKPDVEQLARDNKLALALPIAHQSESQDTNFRLLKGFLGSSRKTTQQLRDLVEYLFSPDANGEQMGINWGYIRSLLHGPGSEDEKLTVLDALMDVRFDKEEIESTFFKFLKDSKLSLSLRQGINQIIAKYPL